MHFKYSNNFATHDQMITVGMYIVIESIINQGEMYIHDLFGRAIYLHANETDDFVNLIQFNLFFHCVTWWF